MIISEKLSEQLNTFMQIATDRTLELEDYRKICEALKISKVYYDMNLGGDSERYRNQKTKKLVFTGSEEDGKIVLYDNGDQTDLRLVYPYYYEGFEYVHAYIEFKEGITREDIDPDIYKFMANIVYLLVSRTNMRLMLDFAEITDPMTGIPNSLFIAKKYEHVKQIVPVDEIAVLRVNIQNFRFINETVGAAAGDEVLIQYAHWLMRFVTEDQGVCRMGGDNFALFVRTKNLEDVIRQLECVPISQLKKAPNQSFELSAWIGISKGMPNDDRPFGARLNEASLAGNMGKTHLKKNVVVYTEDLRLTANKGREIIEMFHPAIRNGEFRAYFQPKVNMQTGELVGFEALCRWIHEGNFIYPDQFIPILDKEGLIHELDMAIFRYVCDTVRKWTQMGLNVPHISSNFSRKNLFVPDIEEKICNTLQEYGIDKERIEIEITESVQDSEYNRLIDFVRRLKEYGLHISIDDFGTGYSSLALLYNIDADILKVDKSFVDGLLESRKSEVLVETIISTARRMDMEVIAEGVETADQGKKLMQLGCDLAQGYYYSKPVDFETATEYLKNPPFQPIHKK